MPLPPDPDDPEAVLVAGPDGVPLLSTRLREDDGVAGRTRLLPGADPALAAAAVRAQLAGLRLATTDDRLVAALVAGGVPVHRTALDLTHDLAGLPEPAPLPAGWSLAPGGWDDDLAEAVAQAYGPGHVDGPWTDEDTAEVSGMHQPGAALPALAPASARLVAPDGRSAGQVLCAGPVPWVDRGAWVLTIGVADRARGLGLGRALLLTALRGTREAGLPCLGLSVTEGNPALRLYEAAGFSTVARVVSLRLPTPGGT